ncbi:hypothetical protein [Acinetobacter seifertii]|uniref:Uncharacterized protein n=1 Tax=Acinetobacter seifertii TaxID=1530123 RepID=A0A7H2V911_9GAMM|nr:hypothetical protein [Acinetobacter seifertii]QNX72844.1 hypothetical protein IC776_02785 [Acinetobacter seifertii]
MRSTLELNADKKLTDTQILDALEHPMQSMEGMLSAMTKLYLQETLSEQEFTGLMNSIHLQLNLMNNFVKESR